MLILGLLLVIVALALTVAAVYDGGEPARVEIFGYDVSTTVAGAFFVGMATTALLLFGVWLMQASFGRARRRKAERKEAKARQRESVSKLEEERAKLRAENERLAQKLEHERGSSGGTDDARSTTGTGLETTAADASANRSAQKTHGGSDAREPDGGDARAEATSSGATDIRQTEAPRHARE